jgi:hypothetical protein
VDLVFGSNSELRALAVVYGSCDGGAAFAQAFAKAGATVMNLDRYDLPTLLCHPELSEGSLKRRACSPLVAFGSSG